MTDTRHIIVIGGGISGLATAYTLQEEARKAGSPVSYTLLEKDNRLGGKIITDRADGFVIEGGPDCFISQKRDAADLCRRLGIGDDLMGTNDERRKTFVVNHRRLTPLPDGVMLIIPTRIMPFVTSPLISWPGKLRMGMDLLIPRRPDDADESIADFVRRRLGREALAKIAEPLLSGIHVSDPEMQSLLGTFPRFRALEVNHRSLILGMLAGKRRPAAGNHGNGTGGGNGHSPSGPTSLFMSLRGGLSRLVETLQAALTGQVLTGVQATAVTRAEDGRFLVQTADGQALRGDAVVLASPAYVSGELIAGMAPELAQALAAIRYVSTATISLGYRAADVSHLLKGFGYVVPRQEHRQVSACTWTSTKFNHRAPEGMALVRCFVGGPGHEELVDLSDDELVALARREMKEIVGLDAQPVISRIFRWRRANPQYDVGHLDRMQQMRSLTATQPGLFI
ncbi:MAG TPA: protoporphyrinogen oxidase, partial [Anaerolineae bacterium]